MPAGSRRKRPRSLVERTLASFVDAMEHAFYAEELARTDGLLQRIDPRVKAVGIVAVVIAVVLAHKLWMVLGLFAVAVVMAALSHVPLQLLAKRIWIEVLLFTGVIALPAPFITPGQPLVHVPVIHWAVTAQGLTAAGFLVMRVEAAATLTVLLVLSTPWSHVLKALRVLRLPAVAVVILGMTYRYIFLLLQTAHDMFESRRSRMVGELEGSDRRRVAAASVGVLISKSFQLSSGVYMAMQSRGFRGDVHVLEDFQTRPLDWIVLAGFFTLAIAAVWFGR
ncbi:MAG: cobalt ECF transporter T component CbiQ [Terriglobia bacterium]